MAHEVKFPSRRQIGTPPAISEEEIHWMDLEFEQAYGAALRYWARTEQGLFNWFHIITKMKEPIARRVFYSAHTFTARVLMVETALSVSKLRKPYPECVAAAVTRCRSYSGFRNRITHGEAWVDGRKDSKTFKSIIIVSGSLTDAEAEDRSIGIAELKFAARNFSNLAAILIDSSRLYREPKRLKAELPSPATFLALVDALPAQADSTASNPMRAKRRRRSKASHR